MAIAWKEVKRPSEWDGLFAALVKTKGTRMALHVSGVTREKVTATAHEPMKRQGLILRTRLNGDGFYAWTEPRK